MGYLGIHVFQAPFGGAQGIYKMDVGVRRSRLHDDG